MKAKGFLMGLMVWLLMVGSVGAEIPRLISFQGVLKDSSGNPVSGNQMMTFSLYTQPVGGVAIWTEVRTGVNNVSVDNGLYNVLLGETTTGGIPASVAFDTSYWLGITVGSDPEMSPRYRLTASPYALGVDVDTSSCLWRTTGSDIYRLDGKVGIGTNQPPYKLAIKGSGNEIYTVMSETGSDDVDNLKIQIAPGNGTPLSRIGYLFGNFGELNRGFLIGNLRAAPLRFGVGPIERMRINPDGNVGIGTTNPTAKLEVAGQVKITGGNPGAGKVLTSSADGLASWQAPAAGGHFIGESYGGGIVFYVYDNGQHGLIAATSDQGTSTAWYAGTYTNTMAFADGVGAGKANTAIIIANQGYGKGNIYAARLCNEYSVTVGGVTYGDWYLPSKHELNLLYLQRSAVGGSVDYGYWSSTEYSSYIAWYQYFANGSQDYYYKPNPLMVRAVRAF